jgi:uncharacterized protein (TIRG00374 family)
MTEQDLKKFKSVIAEADFWLIIPVMIAALAAHVSRAFRWRVLIEPMGYAPSLFNTFGCIMTGYLINSFIPRFGEIVRCTLLSRYEKIPVEKLIGTIVFERIFDLLCYIIFIAITIAIQFPLVGGFAADSFSSFSHADGKELLVKGIIIFVFFIIAISILVIYYKKKKHTSIAKKIKTFFKGMIEGITTVSKLKQRRWFIGHTLFIWAMYLLQIYIGFYAIKELNHLGFGASCSVLTLATLAMVLMPGGLGAFPKAVAWVLLLYSIEAPIGEAFGFLMWGATTFITLFFGLAFTGLLYFVNKKKQYAVGQ